MKRDQKNFELAQKHGDNFVWVELNTGRIMGRSRNFVNACMKPENRELYEMMTLAEYAWMTDETRETKIVTGADLYDKIEWTRNGFRIDGEFFPFKKS